VPPVLLLALSLCSAPESVVIVLPWDGDSTARPAAQHLRSQLDLSARVWTTTLATDVQAMMKSARDTFEYAVVLDTPRARITVVRAKDGTILSRTLDPAVANESPYAVALSAMQLLDVAREVKQVAVIDGRPVVAGRTVTFRASLALDAAIAVAAGSGQEAVLAQPMLGIALVMRATDTAWWASLGFRARAFGGRAIALSDTASDLTMRYERTDGVLRLLIGRTEGRIEYALALEGGGSNTRASARPSAGGAVIAEDRRLNAWGGAGLEGRLRLFGGISLALGGTVAFVPQPTRYHVREEVYAEGKLRLVGGAGLIFEL
jgi:hypothetical protein